MSLQEIRESILTAHAWLREQIERLHALAKIELESQGPDHQIRSKIVDFCDALRGHIDVEEELLRPVLQQLDAWGDARVERLEEDHRQQRLRIAQIRHLARDMSFSLLDLAGVCKEFLEELEMDMQREERDILAEDIFRDDALSVHQVSG
jgi:iron-sulfur cluster repair protein YtfE (RIC family)